MNKYRLVIFPILIILLTVGLIGRLFYLQVYKYEHLKKKSTEQLKKIVKIAPHRGDVFDRNGNELALTKTAFSAYAIPRSIEHKYFFSKQIAPIIDKDEQDIYALINNELLFVWLIRKIDTDTYEQLKDLKLSGLHFIQEKQRVYPYKNLFSQVVGFVGIDNQGLSNLEYSYNKYLTGNPGRIIVDSDPRGYRIISGEKKTLDSSYDGGHIYLTLDNYIQYVSRKYLIQSIMENRAESGSVIVMNPKTGEILAMVNYPDFDANSIKGVSAFRQKNRCITDMYEPGSVFKMVTIASVLEEAIVEPGDVLYVPETLKLGNRIIREAHRREKGESAHISVSEILEKSLNVGTTLLAQKLGEEAFYKYMKAFGFGQFTDIDTVGESPGILRPTNKWSSVDIGMMSFGQGIATTPLQVANAISAIANKGILLKPRIINYFADKNYMNIKTITKSPVRRVISEKTAKKVTDMMVKVVEHGTGTTAKIKGISIAGKTGTAQIPNTRYGGYLAGKYIASFIGFFPADDAEILILVKVDKPKKSIWGSSVAGPVFRNIARDVIDYLDIHPGQKQLNANKSAITFSGRN